MKKNRLIAIRLEEELDNFLKDEAILLLTTKSRIIHDLIVKFYRNKKHEGKN